MEIGPETAAEAERLLSSQAAPLESSASSPGENISGGGGDNNNVRSRFDLLDDDEEGDVCRICRNPGDVDNPLRYPCACSGSIKFVHQDCLLQWLNHSNARQCEV